MAYAEGTYETGKVYGTGTPMHSCDAEFNISPHGWFRCNDLLWTCSKCRRQWAQRGNAFKEVVQYTTDGGLPVNPFAGRP